MPSVSSRTPSFSAQLIAWTMPPSSWLIAPSGLITSPPSQAHHTRVTRIVSVDLDFGDDGGIGGEVLVLRKADAAARARCRPARSRLASRLISATRSMTARARGSARIDSR